MARRRFHIVQHDLIAGHNRILKYVSLLWNQFFPFGFAGIRGVN